MPKPKPLSDSTFIKDHQRYPKQLCHQLKFMRMASGLTQFQLAEISGLCADTINTLETGYYLPRVDTLNRLAQALGCALEIKLIPLGPPRRLDYLRLNRAGQVVRQRKHKTLGEVQALVGKLERLVPVPRYRRQPALPKTKTSAAPATTPHLACQPSDTPHE